MYLLTSTGSERSRVYMYDQSCTYFFSLALVKGWWELGEEEEFRIGVVEKYTCTFHYILCMYM